MLNITKHETTGGYVLTNDSGEFVKLDGQTQTTFESARECASYAYSAGVSELVYAGDFGTVTILRNCVAVDAFSRQLYEWAHRPGAAWPCSALADDECDGFGANFDSNGMYERRGENDYMRDNLGNDEFSAWSSDAISEVLPTDHPAYFVTVGQFN